MNSVEVVIIGAGPYGLSLAAHLKAAGISHRIFGAPMSFWRENMPERILLKSAGFALSLYDPISKFTLKRYCAEKGIHYADVGHHVALDTFRSFGLEFQRRIVPYLEQEWVERVEAKGDGFSITLASGTVAFCNRVILAVGVSLFAHVPEELERFSKQHVSHTSDINDLSRFEGKRVAVVGAGASAVDMAALLHETGAEVHLISRRETIEFPSSGPEGRSRTLLDRVLKPMTSIGTGWKSVFCAQAPLLFRQMPSGFRHKVVKRYLGPAPGHFLRDRVVGKVQMHLGCKLSSAHATAEGVSLRLSSASGEKHLKLDHVVAGTGFRFDINRLNFLSPEIRNGVRLDQHAPKLTANFESSVPGLHFVGMAAAPTFGPLLRFACGAEFACARLSRHLRTVQDRAGMTVAMPSFDTQS